MGVARAVAVGYLSGATRRGNMKMQRFTVTFERSMTVTVLAPADTTTDEIDRIAQSLDLDRDWDPPAWDSWVDRGSAVGIPDANLVLGPPNKYGHRNPVGAEIGEVDAVLSDDRDNLVSPTDASWWVTGRASAPVHAFDCLGQKWAVSIAAVVRADAIPDGFNGEWISELPTALEQLLAPQRMAATDRFDPKYGPLLALGVACRDAGSSFVSVMRGDEVLAVVGPCRGGALRVVDGVAVA